MRIKLNLDLSKSVEFILTQIYFSEFRSIDTVNQHPDGLNFYEWLNSKDLISNKHLNEIAKILEEDES